MAVAALTTGPAPGFITIGSANGAPSPPLSRLYLNIDSSQAAAVLGSLATELDGCGLGYWLKALANPSQYYRRDAAVLYVESAAVQLAASVVQYWLDDRCFALQKGTPLLTRPMATGLGLADEPDDLVDTPVFPASHGLIVAAWLSEATHTCRSGEEVAEFVIDRIQTAGRDPRQPYFRRRDVERRPRQ